MITRNLWVFFFFKQKTAYEMRISDWSSDVCSSDLSIAMLDASRPLGDGAGLQLRAMASLDPLMGKRGYPILFASGETANGEPLKIGRASCRERVCQYV